MLILFWSTWIPSFLRSVLPMTGPLSFQYCCNINTPIQGISTTALKHEEPTEVALVVGPLRTRVWRNKSGVCLQHYLYASMILYLRSSTSGKVLSVQSKQQSPRDVGSIRPKTHDPARANQRRELPTRCCIFFCRGLHACSRNCPQTNEARARLVLACTL